jgi:hypothetical protein
MKTVIFACVHNAGRSQMAAAFFNAIVDPAAARAISAGTQPGDRVHPEVAGAMRGCSKKFFAWVAVTLASHQTRLFITTKSSAQWVRR